MKNILEILRQHKAELFSKYPIKEMALFGSYSRGDNTAESDIDIMVELSEPLGIEFIKIAHELEDIFEKKIDLVSRNGIKPRYFEYLKKDLKYV